MGTYLNPENKEQWVAHNATLSLGVPEYVENNDTVVLCLVVNPGFSALALMFSKEEYEYWKNSFETVDRRPHMWYTCPISPELKSLVHPTVLERFLKKN